MLTCLSGLIVFAYTGNYYLDRNENIYKNSLNVKNLSEKNKTISYILSNRSYYKSVLSIESFCCYKNSCSYSAVI